MANITDNVQSILAADDWRASYAGKTSGGKVDVPLVAWAWVVNGQGIGRLVGMTATDSDGRAVELVDEGAGDFLGYRRGNGSVGRPDRPRGRVIV